MTLANTQTITYSSRHVRKDNYKTTDVVLTHPVDAMTTQEDANIYFHNRITALEEQEPDELTEIDGGSY